MKTYISDRADLSCIRVGEVPPATGGVAPIELLARLPSDDCGCPEEHWRIDGFDYLIHLEEDGTGDMMIFAGDFEADCNVATTSMDDLRSQMFAWHSEMQCT